MTNRRIMATEEYQEGHTSAEVNGGGAEKDYNPYIAGTTQWQRWGNGWEDHRLKVRGVCKYHGCQKEYNRDEVARQYGKFSSVFLLGYCSAQCYTKDTVKGSADEKGMEATK